jgi:hypothetical protein
MFIKSEYDENDARAKAKCKELMAAHPKYGKFKLEEPSDPFTVDFYVYDTEGTHVANVEVEVKKTWQTVEFEYSDVQLLPRKKKYWTDEAHHKNKHTLFVMFNRDLTNHLVIKSPKMTEIFSNNKTRNYGTDKTRNDSFYVVKKEDCLFGHLNPRIPSKPAKNSQLL